MTAQRIVLMRHGRPLVARAGWVRPPALRAWIASYDAAVADTSAIPAPARRHAEGSATIVASPLARAFSSAEALGARTVLKEDCFREAELPCPRGGWLALPAWLWLPALRLLWLAAYAGGQPGRVATGARAAVAARKLAALAENGPVLLVGHGIFNRLIGRELRRLGWRGAGRNGAGGYWSCQAFER